MKHILFTLKGCPFDLLDDKEFIRINRLTGADAGIPPAGLFVVHAVIARGVMITAQGMADQDSIGAVGVEFAISLVDQVILF